MNWGMTMVDKDTEDSILETHFAAARCANTVLPAGLTARMLADADRVQSDRLLGGQGALAGAGRWRQLLALLGGWPAMGGLATACAAGVWIGVSPPDFLPDPVGLMAEQNSSVNLLDSYALSSVLPEDG